MKREDNLNDVRLEDAFQLFNQLSETLAESYGDLQIQVEHLSTELAEARSEKLEQLAEKERLANRLEGLLDTLPAGIVVLDRLGWITQTNPVAHDMLGEDLIGQAWEVVAKGMFVVDGDELRLQDGRWISISVRSLDADPGKIILITDISETHALQKIVSRQQRLTALGEMIARLAHQIRTPLATALLYLSNLSHPQARAVDRVHYGEKARERLHHLERMVNDMLIFARGDVSDSESFVLGDFVEEFRQALEPQFERDDTSLIIEYQAGHASLRGNRDALLSAFHNLVNNAIEANDDRLILKIEVSRVDEGTIEFRFKDNGCGIPEDIKERIMEPFFTTRKHGTGLGLAVVNATISSFKGRFEISSEEGVGSCFSIQLPLFDNCTLLPSEITHADRLNRSHVARLEARDDHSNEVHYPNEVSV